MTNPSATPADAPLLFGRYRVYEQLGEGRLAAVYAAVDERLQRNVLLHLMRKDLVEQEALRQRFLAEINASAQRSHPALLEVFDSGEVQNRPFMITEHATGRPLKDLGVLSVETAILYMRQIVGAVATCQQQQIPHPPISSNNILLVSEGRIKLVESWHMKPADVAFDLTHYRAPERASGQPPGPANAVYALGVLLYELLTGIRPVSGADARAVVSAHLSVRIPPISHNRPTLYLPTLEGLLAQATARLPEQRLPDAAAFGAALDTFWRDLSRSTQPLPSLPTRQRRQSRPQPVEESAPPPKIIEQPPVETFQPSEEVGYAHLQPLDREKLRQQTFTRGIVGWIVLIGLTVGVAFGSYTVASYVVDQFFAIKLPQPDLPNFGVSLPEWPFAADQGEVLIVNINEGLNLRDEPGLSTNVVAIVPNGTPVRKLEGPQIIDNVPWVRVRIDSDVQPNEGWMSLNFLIPAE